MTLRARRVQAGGGQRRRCGGSQSVHVRQRALRGVLLAAAASVLCAACASGPDARDTADLEAVVSSVWSGQSPAAAVLRVDNDSGQIVDSVVVGDSAMAPLGGRGRPAGSVMKVVVLAAALEAGIEADDVLSVPRCLLLSQHRACTEFPGETTVAEAIVVSNNPAFVMLNGLVGSRTVVEYGSRVGMDLEPSAAIPLGPDLVSMEAVASLFVALANDGETVAIRDQAGIAVIPGAGRFVSADTARRLRLLLRSVVARGTGVAADGPDDPYGKTGTASGHTDAWFAGSTGGWTIVVWAGSADGTTAVAPPKFRSALAGGGLPAEIFRAVADELGVRTRLE